jgi:hypothetical protein
MHVCGLFDMLLHAAWVQATAYATLMLSPNAAAVLWCAAVRLGLLYDKQSFRARDVPASVYGTRSSSSSHKLATAR